MFHIAGMLQIHETEKHKEYYKCWNTTHCKGWRRWKTRTHDNHTAFQIVLIDGLLFIVAQVLGAMSGFYHRHLATPAVMCRPEPVCPYGQAC